jgi:epoxide hydrolase-like predicted phosphatase
MSREIKAIVFDMGGVIILTCDHQPRIELAKRLGIPIKELEDEVFSSDSAIRSELGEYTKYQHWEKILEKKKKNRITPHEADDMFWAGDCIDNELMEYIYKLKEDFIVGFISNAFTGAREWVDDHFHFLKAFDLVLFSYEVGLRKPDARIYTFFCDRLGVLPRQSVFIDDLEVNVEGAGIAGLYAIQYKNQIQLKKDLSKLLIR